MFPAAVRSLGCHHIPVAVEHTGGYHESPRIPVEFTCIPQIYMMTARALEITCANMARLVVHADRMRYNVCHNVLDQSSSERLMIAIYKKNRREKQSAHAPARPGRQIESKRHAV